MRRHRPEAWESPNSSKTNLPVARPSWCSPAVRTTPGWPAGRGPRPQCRIPSTPSCWAARCSHCCAHPPTNRTRPAFAARTFSRPAFESSGPVLPEVVIGPLPLPAATTALSPPPLKSLKPADLARCVVSIPEFQNPRIGLPALSTAERPWPQLSDPQLAAPPLLELQVLELPQRLPVARKPPALALELTRWQFPGQS